MTVDSGASADWWRRASVSALVQFRNGLAWSATPARCDDLGCPIHAGSAGPRGLKWLRRSNASRSQRAWRWASIWSVTKTHPRPNRVAGISPRAASSSTVARLQRSNAAHSPPSSVAESGASGAGGERCRGMAWSIPLIAKRVYTGYAVRASDGGPTCSRASPWDALVELDALFADVRPEARALRGSILSGLDVAPICSPQPFPNASSRAETRTASGSRAGNRIPPAADSRAAIPSQPTATHPVEASDSPLTEGTGFRRPAHAQIREADDALRNAEQAVEGLWLVAYLAYGASAKAQCFSSTDAGSQGDRRVPDGVKEQVEVIVWKRLVPQAANRGQPPRIGIQHEEDGRLADIGASGARSAMRSRRWVIDHDNVALLQTALEGDERAQAHRSCTSVGSTARFEYSRCTRRVAMRSIACGPQLSFTASGTMTLLPKRPLSAASIFAARPTGPTEPRPSYSGP